MKKTPQEIMDAYRAAGGPPVEYVKGWYKVGEHKYFRQSFRAADLERLTAQLEWRKKQKEEKSQ